MSEPNEKKFKRTILIDLDGVLNNYSKFEANCIPEIKNGAKKFLEQLSKDNNLYLFTTRNLLLSAKWLINNNIDKYFTDVTNTKIPAYLHIDDRCICFNGDYEQTLAEIEKFKVYWKN